MADKLVYLIEYMIEFKHLSMVSSQFLTYLNHLGSWMGHDMPCDDVLDITVIVALL